MKIMKLKCNSAGLIFLSCIGLLLANNQLFAQESILTQQGSFVVGCNYWASNAGTHMWRDWRPDIIEKDFKQLSENGIKVLRVFPLWPDFQPIYQIYSAEGSKKYISFKDEPLPDTGPGVNGVSELQLQHFEIFASLAQKYNLKLIVGLVTGWMSGQLYVPPALEGRNILTDAESLTWQQKFVTTFVNRLKNQPSIIAWDFGNECNVMEKVENHYQAYVWASVISGAIRSEDKTRPVVSGMHGLSAADNAQWRIIDQAALTDLLTTHPYSLFTPFAGQDAINSIRTILHSAAETSLYSDIAGKPCLTEETGVLGPMTAGENEKAAFARSALFSNWAHDCKGMLWWCGYDQLSLDFPPYNYSALELQLGLIKEDRTPKQVLFEFKNFSSFLEKLPFKTLPPRKTEAVCILTEGQDNWSVAYSSFILSKQAGFDIKFQKSGQELKDAPIYLVPSVNGLDPFFKDDWFRILEKVKQGAILYLSLDDTFLPALNEPLGIEIKTNIKRRGTFSFISVTGTDSLNFITTSERKYIINPMTSKVIANESDGNPAFTESQYGKGKIYLLTFPLENNLSTSPGAFDKKSPAYYEIYKQFAKTLIDERILKQDNPNIGVTEHDLNLKEKVVILINYNSEDASIDFRIKEGWKISGCLYGEMPALKNVTIKGNDALVLMMKKL
jgi:beta-galactosidase